MSEMERKTVNGVYSWRVNGGPWIPYTPEQLTTFLEEYLLVIEERSRKDE